VTRKRTIYAADLFAGAGGTSTGLMSACARMGLDVELLAINHWDTAVETHAKNHPEANHLCASLDTVDPSKVVPRRKLDLLVASPECVHFSTARGGKPMDDQSRASAWHVLHWAERLRVERILIENVREFLTWGPLGANGQPLKSRKGETFTAFVTALESLGYAVEWRILNCADLGDATTRQRLFISAVRGHGRRRPAWPDPTHAKAASADLSGRTLSRWRAAREIIDWGIPGESIFRRKRPLAPTTLRRIEEGLRRFGGAAAEPFLVLLRGTGRDQIPSTARPLNLPLPSPTAGGGHAALIEPFLLQQQSGGVPRPTSQPAPTVATDGAISLVEPFLCKVNHGEKDGEKRPGGNAHRTRSVRDPVPTITATSRGIGLVQPFIVTPGGPDLRGGRATDEPLPTVTCRDRMGVVEPFIVKTGHKGGNGAYVRKADDPLYAVTTAPQEQGVCEPFLVKYHGTGRPAPVDAPAPTLTTKDRLGLVEPVALDIRFRMLQPHELAAAMSFPADYKFAGTKSDVVRQIGNAVPCRTAEALCRAALEGSAA
jgi:DNA (cytosine-5)-methyltransferase 1